MTIGMLVESLAGKAHVYPNKETEPVTVEEIRAIGTDASGVVKYSIQNTI